MNSRIFAAFLLLFTTSHSFAQIPFRGVARPTVADKLPSLGLDKNSVTVSGLSAGAFMAVQMGVAYSDQIHGVASVAGGIYSCALGQSANASGLCMKTPDKIDVATYVKLVQDSFQKGLIADPRNITSQKIFILNGTEDKTVAPAAGAKLAEFYHAFGASPVVDFNLRMGHGFPSNSGTNACESTQLPWVNHCSYEGAQKIFETMYGPLSPPPSSRGLRGLSGELRNFDQTPFNSAAAKMLDYGSIYVPRACNVAHSNCRLHVALHGCMQSPNVVQQAFTSGADYNAWADTNHIVVLYPATTMSAGNSAGCWDWFGYTNADYAVQKSLQMTAVMNMIRTLTSN